MAYEVISSRLTSRYTIDSSDFVYVHERAGVTNNGIAIVGDNDGEMHLSIDGTIISASTTVNLGNTSTETSELVVTLGETAVVRNLNIGSAINIRRTGADIINHGEITSILRGINFATGATEGNIVNTGFIEAIQGNGISVVGDAASISGTFDIFNSGLIDSEQIGISINYQNLTLLNTGSIFADIAVFVSSNDTQSNTLELNNSGELIGQTYAVVATDSDDIVLNSGSISGDVILNGGNDHFDGRGGTLSGTVAGGDGDDTYIIDEASIELSENISEGTDLVQSLVGWKLGDNFENLDLLGSADLRGVGNEEDNAIKGNIGDNKLYGRSGNDTIAGKAGDDFISGQDGVDTLYGGNGSDTLRGGKGKDNLDGGDGDDDLRGGASHDHLSGGSGNDILNGNGGNDTLLGRAGDDILIGGRGQDILTGGGGNDVFVFRKEADSARVPNADHITDFTSGEDLIDLSAFAGEFEFVTGAYTGTGAEVRVTVDGGNSRIRIDLDGDGITDMNIFVDGVTGLTAADFLL